MTYGFPGGGGAVLLVDVVVLVVLDDAATANLTASAQVESMVDLDSMTTFACPEKL
jgi:hypothetical protein